MAPFLLVVKRWSVSRGRRHRIRDAPPLKRRCAALSWTMTKLSALQKAALTQEREDMLQQIERALQPPMLVLGFLWLVLIVFQLVSGLSRPLKVAATLIWIVFILDFLLRFTIAPKKKAFLRSNWLTTLALLVPALRIFQVVGIVRVLTATGGLNIVQIVGTLNRGMNALGATLGRRGFGYVSLLTILVALVGAAGMYGFERGVPDANGIHDYGGALYWTLMLITTIGSEYWPKTVGGRALTVLLSFYAVAILGYIAASLATFFIDRDADDPQAAVASDKTLRDVLDEVRALREEMKRQNLSE